MMSDDNPDREPEENAMRFSTADDDEHSLLTRVFKSLSNPRRRYALYQLQDTPQIHVDDLAMQITAWEQGATREAVSDDHRERIHLALVQSHLPTLEDYGFITYDAQSGVVHFTNSPTVLDKALALAAQVEHPA